MKIATLIGDKATVEVSKDEATGKFTVSHYGELVTKDQGYALEVARYIAQHGPGDVVA